MQSNLLLPYDLQIQPVINNLISYYDVKAIERDILLKQLNLSLTEEIFANSNNKIKFVNLLYVFVNKEAGSIDIRFENDAARYNYYVTTTITAVSSSTLNYEFYKLSFSGALTNAASNLYINYLRILLN